MSHCVLLFSGVSPEKFYTLPHRKKRNDINYGSLDRRVKRRDSLEQIGPRKPPRIFTSSTPIPQRTSVFDVFKKEKKPEPKKSSLRRSVSDASALRTQAYGSNSHPLRKRSGSDNEEIVVGRKDKKQLSPIIEVTQRDDYFEPLNQENKENIQSDNIDLKAPDRKKKKESVTDQLKKFIDEVDEELYKETGIRVASPEEPSKDPQPIIIDLDKAEKISNRKTKKFKDTNLGKKLKSITRKKVKPNEVSKIKKSPPNKPKDTEESNATEDKPVVKAVVSPKRSVSPSAKIKEFVGAFENPNRSSPKMIHSSQKPADKLPLTKGRTVNSIVKRLSNEYSSSPPPPTTTNILITPRVGVQHNNNQPFSYTRGLSPEKYISNEKLPSPTSPVIYAQVVCGSNGTGPKKQTVHAAYTNGKKQPHSDSDEGLGGEENSGISRHEKTITHFGDNTRNYFDEVDKFNEESPITPKFRTNGFHNGYTSYEKTFNDRNDYTGYFDSSNRGRGDGMDAKRRESLTEPHENGFNARINGRSDLSARRDLLESRINQRMNDHSLRTSPEYHNNPTPTPTNVYISETTSKLYRNGYASPVGYTQKYISETRTDKFGKPHTTESSSKHYFGNNKQKIEYGSPKMNNYQYNGFDSEPKSFDSQMSDYRSSPENRQFEASQKYNSRTESSQKVYKNRDLYKSNPEIHMRAYHENQHNDTYHDSLRRDTIEGHNKRYNGFDSRYIDDQERKEKLVDSGIENDCRRDSGENFRTNRAPRRGEYCNESEDEGFASSLLIASERQHTDENTNYRRRDDRRRDYDSDRHEDPFRNVENMEYKRKFRPDEYQPRERSIDDGSHYDPRIDKEYERSTLKRVEEKPPKPEKKSSLEKVS